jgi:hypothetical protein
LGDGNAFFDGVDIGDRLPMGFSKGVVFGPTSKHCMEKEKVVILSGEAATRTWSYLFAHVMKSIY